MPVVILIGIISFIGLAVDRWMTKRRERGRDDDKRE